MLHEIGRELEAKLLAKGCPFKVVDREALKPATSRNVIVIEHDGDTFGPPRLLSTNPKRHYTRVIGVKLTIYAQSANAGAAEFEHRRVAERVLDLALVSLRKVLAERRNAFAIKGGKYVVPADLEKSEAQGGAVYELSFTLEHGVAEHTWAGANAPEGVIADVQSTTEVKPAASDEDPETVEE